jgi:hypothetical protein
MNDEVETSIFNIHYSKLIPVVLCVNFNEVPRFNYR